MSRQPTDVISDSRGNRTGTPNSPWVPFWEVPRGGLNGGRNFPQHRFWTICEGPSISDKPGLLVLAVGFGLRADVLPGFGDFFQGLATP